MAKFIITIEDKEVDDEHSSVELRQQVISGKEGDGNFSPAKGIGAFAIQAITKMMEGRGATTYKSDEEVAAAIQAKKLNEAKDELSGIFPDL
jgi:hypothetical protein